MSAVLLKRKAMKGLKGFLKLKGFKVSVISSNPPRKDGNARFTAAPLKASSYYAWINIHVFFTVYFYLRFSAKWLVHFLLITRNEETSGDKYLLSRINDGIFHIFDQKSRFQENRRKSGIAIFAWRFTSNCLQSL